ncbi:hypothetical protein [Lacticaseibacillus nasuensis]|uniref:Uncharacterized protein n=2 Tax=Lacticaseibacillus TaxID=2759736 RepID=A0A0R1JPV0_9LACO|nr:hypothetical protein [Lacticaseibacillus nasuensis]KRK70193.1 hypothetical protein FD02_GL000649 [Lacticaseibacillus nasuensis JCM 17158]
MKMQADDYIAYANAQLERLLVYETVFKEYVHTAKNIEKGNCYASESLERLRDYFSKNVLRFTKFIGEVEAVTPPAGFCNFHAELVGGLQDMSHAVSVTLMGIEPTGVNHQLFDVGCVQEAAARTRIDHAFDQLHQPQAM